ncbi:hypothetical protein ACFVMC_18710 [Nocardia sp. NPDC127579]|uniref:hypothetical protein n=1 Tax=Nocardia sp. NPDC127579 TaxID=3345402 RepID=UPI003640A193
MSDQEGRNQEPGGNEPDRKVIRLPRRPRRVTEDTAPQPRKTWRTDTGSSFDPAPTRPVSRSELQGETGWWRAETGADSPPETDGTVVDLDTLRRRRAAENGSIARVRRVPKARRISDPPKSDPPDEPGPQ